METAENYQQPAVGNKEQIVIIDPALTAETDELNPAFEAEQLAGPEDEDDDTDDEDDDNFPGLDQDDEADPDLSADDEEEDF